ncbi:hypothetical protein [Hyphomonas sp. ND6WE1B]|uniref:hypothetical protein n=1 Tax=Hyphomonas sp. ND6WE1B TaxID=1848191 RepID=UPI00111244EC|nr:hypothetical protein [Hyphomonas sp. ND6WE1B]
MATVKSKSSARAPAKERLAKPKSSAALAPKELRAVAAHCATPRKANSALKAYIAAGRSAKKAS